MTITPEETEKWLRPVTGKTCQYSYVSFDLRGTPEIKYVTMPYVTCAGPGPYRVKRRED